MKTSLAEIVTALEAHYGQPRSPAISDPLELILWENIGYLVDDDRRGAAFAALRQNVGLKPPEILGASTEQLLAVIKLGGIHPELRAPRLKEIAHIVLNDFAGDLDAVVKLPIKQAIKALKKFPSIGEPGAEKILLFTKAYPVLAVDSNGLRVLLRLGFGQEHRNYSTSYNSVREALRDQIGDDCEFLIRAHQLLRQHGKELCRRTNPACDECPIRESCRFYSMHARDNSSH